MIEQLHFHFSLSCIGEGNSSLLQCSCLENPWDGGAGWAAICWVTQSQTRLKRLSSSSSRINWGLPKWLSGKESTFQCRKPRLDSWDEKIPWRRKWQPTLVSLPGKSHGQRSLAGYSLGGCKESDTTKWLNSSSRIGWKSTAAFSKKDTLVSGTTDRSKENWPALASRAGLLNRPTNLSLKLASHIRKGLS